MGALGTRDPADPADLGMHHQAWQPAERHPAFAALGSASR
jgi:hypothetical protein